MGPEVQRFEEELQTYLETDYHVICVNSGTAALHLALEACDVGVADEVLVPSLTYVASYQAISASGATPVACDVHPDTALLDLKDAERRITPQTKAIMAVHYGGQVAAYYQELYAFAERHGLRVIEDAAHAFGTRWDGKKIGAQGDIICFSFDSIKNITCGEGGAVLTADSKVAQRIRDARLLGVEKDTDRRYASKRSWEFDVKHQGWRYHMSSIYAAIGRAQLSRFSDFSAKRQALAKLYHDGLSDLPGIQLFDLASKDVVPHIYPILVADEKRDDLQIFLREQNIETGFHYKPNHLLSKYKTDYKLPVVEKMMTRLMTLPLHCQLDEKDVQRVCQSLREGLACS